VTALVIIAAVVFIAGALGGFVMGYVAYRVGYAKGTEDAGLVVLVRCSSCPLAHAPWRMEDRWLD
jgi:hypothetical protein